MATVDVKVSSSTQTTATRQHYVSNWKADEHSRRAHVTSVTSNSHHSRSQQTHKCFCFQLHTVSLRYILYAINMCHDTTISECHMLTQYQLTVYIKFSISDWSWNRV